MNKGNKENRIKCARFIEDNFSEITSELAEWQQIYVREITFYDAFYMYRRSDIRNVNDINNILVLQEWFPVTPYSIIWVKPKSDKVRIR